MTARAAFLAHAATGATTFCRAWALTRRDGLRLGFTDHDGDLLFDGLEFRARTGMTAKALQETTGLSVDNSEAAGALSDTGIAEADLLAGRFDDAEIRVWLVNWADPAQRIERFRGSLGEISRAGGAFKAELRGQTDRLNQAQGRVFQRHCAASLGDGRCGVDLDGPGRSALVALAAVDDQGRLRLSGLGAFADGWFERGRILVQGGVAAGLVAAIKSDRPEGAERALALWSPLPAGLVAGDLLRLEAGCDKRAETCREKFFNFLNFRGFPHIPGEDWLASYPVRSHRNDGGSLGR